MPAEESLHYLETELKEQIAAFDDSRKYFRRQQRNFTIATSVLSALTTIFIGTEKILGYEVLSILALICSAAITVVAAGDQYLRSRELWIQKTDAWMALQNLQAQIEYKKAKVGLPFSQTVVDELYSRFDKIIMREHESWKTVRNSKTIRRGG